MSLLIKHRLIAKNLAVEYFQNNPKSSDVLSFGGCLGVSFLFWQVRGILNGEDRACGGSLLSKKVALIYGEIENGSRKLVRFSSNWLKTNKY